MQYGFIKVASAIPSVKVANCLYNLQQIEKSITEAEEQGVEVIVFPELSITGYTCQDLFHQRILLSEAELSVARLLEFTSELEIISIVGVPVVAGDLLLNCAVIVQSGKLLGIVPKTFLPNYNEFYERRWFASANELKPTEINFAGNDIIVDSSPKVFRTAKGVCFGVEICEDVWAPLPPSNSLAMSGADLIFNLSASDELIGKHAYLESLIRQQSARTMTGYIYSSCGFGESTQDVVYGGNAMIYENGHMIASGERFSLTPQLVISQIDIERLRSERRSNTTYVSAQSECVADFIDALPINDKSFELVREINPLPFIPQSANMYDSCSEIFSIQVMGLAKRLVHTNCKAVVIGISGGLDSTLALLVCVKTFDKLGLSRKGIVGVTMPGFGTTDRTHSNAVTLMDSLGISQKEICISDAVKQHFKDIGHDIDSHDVTYENSQARERTQILMDLSNKLGGMVIGTGDLSELALGWATYNGDHMSMYGVNCSIPKTLIKYMVRHVAVNEVDDITRETLLDIIDTPISPELIPADEEGNISQKTENLVGPYELHDFFLYYFLRFGFRPSKIFLLAKKAFDGTNKDVQKYDEKTIRRWLKEFTRRFFNQQFKRSCLPDGPKVGSVSLSPRGDWRMPTDADSSIWLREIDAII